MHQLAVILTKYMLNKEVILEENYDIYLYGLQIFLEISLNIFFSIIIALFLHMEIECVLFFLLFIPQRSYNGGLHFDNYYTCLFFSCITLLCILLIVNEKEDVNFRKKANIILIIHIIIAVVFILFEQNRYLFLESLVYLLVFFTLLIEKLKYTYINKKEKQQNSCKTNIKYKM